MIITVILTPLELIFDIQRNQVVDLHQQNRELQSNRAILSKDAGRFIYFFLLHGFCAHFCYSKSVTWRLLKWITKCGGLLKCKYKCKYKLIIPVDYIYICYLKLGSCSAMLNLWLSFIQLTSQHQTVARDFKC